MEILYGLFSLIVFGCLLFLAVVTTRFIGGKAKRTLKGRYIDIIETVSLGLDKKIHLIKAGEQFVLVASSGKSVEFLTTINLNEYEENESGDTIEAFDFKKIFEKYIQNFKGMGANSGKKNQADTTQENSFENDVFKGNLNRLRKITTKPEKISTIDGDENTNEK